MNTSTEVVTGSHKVTLTFNGVDVHKKDRWGGWTWFGWTNLQGEAQSVGFIDQSRDEIERLVLESKLLK